MVPWSGGLITGMASDDDGGKGGSVLALLTEEQEMLREMAVKLAASAGVATPNDLDTGTRH